MGWPECRLPAEPGPLADAALARVNRSSALWQQYGFLCDVIVLDGDTARYCEEVPVDHVLDGGFGAGEQYVTVTLEYGAGHDAIDPFDVAAGRDWEADPAHEDRYLHPVVRAYAAGAPPRVLHLPEDVCNDWSGEASHRAPLVDFLAMAAAARQPG